MYKVMIKDIARRYTDARRTSYDYDHHDPALSDGGYEREEDDEWYE